MPPHSTINLVLGAVWVLGVGVVIKRVDGGGYGDIRRCSIGQHNGRGGGRTQRGGDGGSSGQAIKAREEMVCADMGSPVGESSSSIVGMCCWWRGGVGVLLTVIVSWNVHDGEGCCRSKKERSIVCGKEPRHRSTGYVCAFY
jgi:hypothetical protein